MLRYLTLILLGLLLWSLTGCGDPRKNCNHPQHEEYIMEKRKKNQGF